MYYKVFNKKRVYQQSSVFNISIWEKNSNVLELKTETSDLLNVYISDACLAAALHQVK